MTQLQTALTGLTRQGKRFFKVDDLVAVLGIERAKAQQIAFRLSEAGLASRLKRGTYVLNPPDAWGERGAPLTDWYEAAAAIAAPAPYSLSYYTAMTLHRMTQHPLRTVFVAVARAQRDITVGSAHFKFVVLAKHRFFGHIDHVLGPGRVVRVTDLERTFIDNVDRPDLCGGLEETVRGFRRRRADLNADRLLRHVMRLKEPAVTKRLGFLLEISGFGEPSLLWELERIAGRSKRYVPLDTTQSQRTGQRNKRWELVINTDLEQLLRVGTS